jgi:hypothetical protein
MKAGIIYSNSKMTIHRDKMTIHGCIVKMTIHRIGEATLSLEFQYYSLVKSKYLVNYGWV